MDFKPIKLSAKWQTVISSIIGERSQPSNTQTQYLKLEDGDQLKLSISYAQTTIQNITVVMFHGLSGDENSSYMVRIAKKLLNLGYHVVRVNHRGANKHLLPLARGIYHAGKSDDIYAVLKHLSLGDEHAQLIPIGFSISGNMLLKALAEHSDNDLSIKHAIAIAPPMDLLASMAKLSQKNNAIFNRHFAKRLYQLFKHRAITHNHYQTFQEKVATLPKNYGVYEIDEAFTAKEAGFVTAHEYYTHSSAKNYLSKIAYRTTILCDHDDPFVDNRFAIGLSHTNIDIQWTHKGGHMGYLSRCKGWRPFEFWLDKKLISLIQNHKE
ncbi:MULTISPECIES: YheT family hydrolase [Cysteiniphilum]|uniref:Alpha/beta hydrolase n=1 Tax=Cysteiniphilum litorale TaxID=2056700 RepID=A0A8J2Z3C4_9GAMM|nr:MULTISPECIES: alpha/beta fold hydrolase [Cysteiniphilum]GGF93989.1 alpha/beta hydrolase [Cysteiniphilum litorale]